MPKNKPTERNFRNRPGLPNQGAFPPGMPREPKLTNVKKIPPPFWNCPKLWRKELLILPETAKKAYKRGG